MGETTGAPALWHRRFAVFYTGRLVSYLGSSMTPVALSFAVLGSGRSTTDLGIVLTAGMVPILALVLVGGSVADRFPRNRVLRLSNLGAGAAQLVAAAILLTGHYSLPAIAVTEFAGGVCTAFTTPALRGIVPQLVDRLHLRRANSLLATARNVTKVAGPALGGVLVATVGGGWAIAADGISFLLAALLYHSITLPSTESSHREGVLSGVRTGWRAFLRIPWMWRVVTAFAVVNIVHAGGWLVLGPGIARQTVGAAGWGVVLSVRAIGVLLAGLAMYRWAIPRLLTLGLLCAAVGAAPLIVLGVHASLPVLLAAALVAGAGFGVFGIAWDTTMQENVPRPLLSRMAAFDDFGSYLGIPIGELLAGPLAGAFGDQAVVLAGGLVLACAALVPLRSPVVRGMRHPPASVPENP
ncbi:MFS transporter [Amycolatopsis jiangsuensis]|uniref:MFS family permease n=1 Tax=Amycolatopsis jiangsuensis TaxID=1181879 RepID=A0A840IWX6_9PSEU|nr:MFS transporter [Amycolatopsis jiangsuensis]MBB4685658.1 MFS family permease [Amycolatopsis jiangsuensis]